MHKSIPIKHTNVILTNIDHIPTNTKISDSSAMLYVFEDNEAAIKMIIKDRSPTMRHVSRTHRVALDWLSDRNNLDSKIQFRYIDNSQNILTKIIFTRDEWHNLQQLFNIIHSSSTCCAKNSSLTSWPNTMANRMQEQRVEERSAAKSKSAAMNLSSHVPTSSSSPKSPITSQSPGILIAQGKPESKMGGNSESDAASHARLKDAYLGGLMDTATVKLVATKEKSNVDLFASETRSEEDVTGKPAAYKTAAVKPHAPSKSACQGREWSHNLQVSPATIHNTEAVFSIVRGIYGRELDDPLSDFDVNMAIWGIFLNATLRAAVHLGQDYEVNLRYVKNNLWNSVGQLSNETGKLISDQTEITGVKDCWFQRNLRGFRQACCARARAKIQAIVRRPEVIQIVFWCGFDACRTRTILLFFFKKKDNKCNTHVESTRCLAMKRRLVDGFEARQESVQSWT